MFLSNSIKRTLYKHGMYVVAIPAGDTSEWTTAMWIEYIDENGTWTV